MGATLRTSAIHRRRRRKEKRLKLRRLLARATPAERAPLEARLHKTYRLLTATPASMADASGRPPDAE